VIDLSRNGDVFVLQLDKADNRVHPELLAALDGALDEVERCAEPVALVTTGCGRFYSNGLDIERLLGLEGPEIAAFLADLDRLFARLLTFPTATVAAINGHAFAAGGMLALAHDFRVMRADRGFFCLPEIDMAMKQPLDQGMYALLGAKLSPALLLDLLVTGRRVGGSEASLLRIVDEAVPEPEVLSRAVARAQALAGKDRETMAALKRGLWRNVLTVLERHDC
jgi:enoyl-CoA hydratase/carnithine racemase